MIISDKTLQRNKNNAVDTSKKNTLYSESIRSLELCRFTKEMYMTKHL